MLFIFIEKILAKIKVRIINFLSISKATAGRIVQIISNKLEWVNFKEYDFETLSSKVKTALQSIQRTRIPITAIKENKKLWK